MRISRRLGDPREVSPKLEGQDSKSHLLRAWQKEACMGAGLGGDGVTWGNRGS